MLRKFMTKLSSNDAPLSDASRRQFPRRAQDQCVSVIGGKTYPVENWSQGGILIYGDGRAFGMQDEIDVSLKFRLRDQVMEVPHKARVVRKTYHNIALQFTEPTDDLKKQFQAVIDDHVASQFADSQLI